MLTIHRSERADALVGALVDVLAEPLADPFAAEVVAVPTRGVERWLTHRLGGTLGAGAGRSDGVCANVEFPFPGRLVGDVLAMATGMDREEDPWRPERLVWPLLDVIDEHLDEPWLELLAAHLGQDADGGADDLRQHRRFATARHLADLFDGYGIHRPEMVLGWFDAGAGTPAAGIPDDAQWQPRLWHAVRDRVGAPSPPERMTDACARVRLGVVELPHLPARVSLFGLTRLPATYLDVLRALAAGRDIHLFALHPSITLWDRIAATRTPPLPIRRADDPTTGVPVNPLLRTWATDTREMQLVLSAAADASTPHHPVDVPPVTTLLHQVQADIRADALPPGRPLAGESDERRVLAPGDRSIEVHSCHGRARQVEIARDAICHALADDPTLEPRDVIVLCPDIDEFAPLLHATFGATAPDPDPASPPAPDRGLPHLPYRLADRSLRQTNPLLATLDALLCIVDGRLTAPEVIGFAGREPVRSRFRFDDDDLDRLAAWTSGTNIRWGLDADRRSRYWLGDVDANSWRAGLDRVLLGVAMDTDGSRMVGGRLPYDDVESGDVDLAGRFTELIDRIDTVGRRTARTQPIETWVDALAEAVDLLMACPARDSWQRLQVESILGEVQGEATTTGDGEATTAGAALSLTEVRALLADRLRGVPTRADFRTGAITMCTLVPMRAVPHRVVCVLGLDDGAFPRTGHADGDDLLRRDPMVGDHDRRTEDRQLLLDALLAATDRFIVTTTGADVRTNERRPPAVPLSELLDVIDHTAVTADAEDATARVVTRHPLQPFDPVAHHPGSGRPWAFDRVHLAGARAVTGTRRAPPPFLPAPLDPVAPVDDVVGLDDLIRFVQHPVREFLRQRLGLNVWEDDEELPDAIPVELDALERWGIGQRLVERLVAGDPLEAAVAAELAVGALPPDAMGQAIVGSIQEVAERIHVVADACGAAGPTSSLEIDLPLGDVPGCGPVALVGTVTGIRHDATCAVSFSSVGARHRLAAWVRVLALSGGHPDTPWRGLTVGKQRSGGRVVEITALDGPPTARRIEATRLLADLVALRTRGLCEPLPVPCKTSAIWADARRRGRRPEPSAVRDWESNHRFDGEAADRSHRTVFGGELRLDQLLAIAPTAFETGAGWAEDEPSRLGRLARRLWDPLLAREVLR